MKKIFFVRHAKSSWDTKYQTDFDREIISRGVEKTNNLATIINKRGEFPNIIISSPAVRALQTAKLLQNNLNVYPEIKINELLYYGTSNNYLNAILELPCHISSVMIIGHNPLITEAVREFAQSADTLKTTHLHYFEIESKEWIEILNSSIKTHFSINPKTPFI